MNRRHFLQTSLLAAALTPTARALDPNPARAGAGFKVSELE